MKLRNLLGRGPIEPVKPIEHPQLGQLTWDNDCSYWVSQWCMGSQIIPVFVPGDRVKGYDDAAVALILPHLAHLESVVDAAKSYLIKDIEENWVDELSGEFTCTEIVVISGRQG